MRPPKRHSARSRDSTSAKCVDLPVYHVKTRFRSGAGRGIRWCWEVYKGNDLNCVALGEVIGAASKARAAGKAAAIKLLERERAARSTMVEAQAARPVIQDEQ